MILRRFYDDWLAQASYLIGCGATGEAIVVDPSRNIEPYLRAAEDEGLRISKVTETHIHADFLSGLRELAAATGACAHLSGCGPAEWQYGFRSDPKITVLQDHDRIPVGNIVLEAVHTPGHTPEHLSFLVTDGAVAREPMGVLSGDFVFVGDVGRPDLLEKAAHVANTAEAGARTLFRSLDWFKDLPDHLQVWPAHGAGSACGKGLSAVPQSTVGYEKRYNWALAIDTEGEFVRQVLAGQPEPPRYFGRMKAVNRDGPPVLGALPRPERLDGRTLASLGAHGAVLVDTRSTAAFAQGHIPGAVNVPYGRSFSTYAGSLLPYDRDLVFLMADPAPATVTDLVAGCVAIGLDQVRGVVGPDALEHWRGSGRAVGSVPQVTASDFMRARDGRLLLDVRNTSEWDAGHARGARLLPLPQLLDRLDEIPSDAEVVVMCQTGSRSAVAASLLKARGREKVANLVGGFPAWAAAGGEVEKSG